MTIVQMLPATLLHAAQMAPLMRAADLAECIASGYPDAISALVKSLENSSETLAVVFDGEVGALVGVSPLGDRVGLIWALTGRAVERAKLSYVRASRQVLSVLLRRYRLLVNLVDARYQGALDWLEVLGFAIGPMVSHPATGEPFRLVTIRGA